MTKIRIAREAAKARSISAAFGQPEPRAQNLPVPTPALLIWPHPREPFAPSRLRVSRPPEPTLTLQGSDLWLEFPFSEAYLAAVDSEKSGDTIPELAEFLGLSTRAVEKQISRLQSENRLRRVGPAKGGHWEVTN